MVETFWTPPLILKGLPAAELPNCERQASSVGAAAFAPNGKSVWMLLSCGFGVFVPNCSDDSGQIYLAGFSIPSGAVISYQAVPGQFSDYSEYVQSVAFPR